MYQDDKEEKNNDLADSIQSDDDVSDMDDMIDAVLEESGDSADDKISGDDDIDIYKRLEEGKDYIIIQDSSKEGAIKKGLSVLRVTEGEVDIQILEEPDESLEVLDLYTVRLTLISSIQGLELERVVEEDVSVEDAVHKALIRLGIEEKDAKIDVLNPDKKDAELYRVKVSKVVKEAEEPNYVVTTGKSLNQAIQEGLRILGVEREAVDLEVLKEPTEPGENYEVRLVLKVEEEEEEEFNPINIAVSDDGFEAYLSLYIKKDIVLKKKKDADNGVYRELVKKETIMEMLKVSRVSYGIDEDRIEELVSLYHSGQEVINEVIARGKELVDSQDAEIEFKVNFEPVSGIVDADTGKIDFHERKIFFSVDEGAVIATRKPPTVGIDGLSVKKRVIRARKGRDKKLLAGKNVEVRQRDGISYYIALTDGRPMKKGDKIEISPLVVIDGNVDYSTGNIDSKESVHVGGNVNSGFKISAKGDIIVKGVVEGAILNVKGDVVLGEGMKGVHKGSIEARGSLYAKYLERTRVDVRGDIVVDNGILDCDILCGGRVKTIGGKGIIIGGHVKAQYGIEANKVGSVYSTATDLYVGIDYLREEALGRIEEEIEKISCRLDAINRKVPEKFLKKEVEVPEKLQEIVEAWEAFTNMQEELMQQKLELVSKDNKITRADICVRDTIYSRVNLSICDYKYATTKELNKVRFYLDTTENEIVYRLL